MLVIVAMIATGATLPPNALEDIRCAASIVAMGRQTRGDNTAQSMAGRATTLQFYLGRLSTRKEGIDWKAINNQADELSPRPAETGRVVLSCSSDALMMQMPRAE